MRAIAPGKYHPPHAGHVRTLLVLAKEYDLTIVVTRDTPENPVMTPEEIAHELDWIAPVTIFDGTLTEQTENPFVDEIVLTGNPKVIDWAKKVGAKHKFIPRSGNISGTQIRGRKS